MAKKICILYSTVDGHTFKICNFMKQKYEAQNIVVDMFKVEDFAGKIADYDFFLIGASIRYGYHRKSVVHFINTNQNELESVKNTFFSVNIVARKPEKRTAETNPYVKKFFEQKVKWRPNIVDVFGGVLDYSSLNWFDRNMIRFIMHLTKGPTKSDVPIEYTDWTRVEALVEKTLKLLNS